MTSRASAVLDAMLGRDDLVSPSARRTLFDRGSSLVQREHAFSPPLGFSSKSQRLLVLLAVAALVVAVGFGWSKLRRPVPIEDRLPIARTGEDASRGPTASKPAVPGTSTTGRSDALAGSGAAEADQGGVAGERAGGNPERIVVHVAGAVVSPGVVTLSVNSRVVDAVTAAGGLRPDADPNRVNLAEILSDGVRVVVPTVGQSEFPAAVPLSRPAGAPDSPKPSTSVGSDVNGGLVNLNTATSEELEELPGVGPATAAAIIAKREKDGPFRSIEGLLDVRGIGEAKLDAVRDLVTVD